MRGLVGHREREERAVEMGVGLEVGCDG